MSRDTAESTAASTDGAADVDGADPSARTGSAPTKSKDGTSASEGDDR